MPAPTDNRFQLSPDQERRRIIPVQQAAEIRGISTDTFKRHYGHLIRKLSPRRNGVMLGDVLEPEETSAA
jgi:hypothetical protein